MIDVQLETVEKLRKNHSDKFIYQQPFTPIDLIDEISSKITAPTNSSVLVLFTVEWALYMREKGYTDIAVAVDVHDRIISNMCIKFGLKYMLLDEIKEKNMKFDVVVGNPPFNKNSKNTGVAGVAGYTGLFKQFVKIGSSLVNPNGFFAFITPKKVVRTLKTTNSTKNCELIAFNLMSTLDVWAFDTCFFVLKNNNKGLSIKVDDPIFSKFLDLERINTFKRSDINKSDSELVSANSFGPDKSVKVIRFLPGKRSDNVTYDYSNSPLIVYGPKVVVTHLDSFKSITATSEPVLAGTTVSFHVNNEDEANRLAAFLKNNKLIKLMRKKLKYKKSIVSFEFFQKFDLSQIQTGYEYPIEYNLTQEEIDYIESTIK